MDQIFYYSNLFFKAIGPYWAELVGAFLMVLTNNLVSIKGTQKETFRLLTYAFCVIILKDVASVIFDLIPVLQPNLVIRRRKLSYDARESGEKPELYLQL